MARPRKDEGKARDRLMQVRLKESEYDEFREAADSSGLELSSWVRERLLIAAKRDLKQQKKPQ